MNATGWSGRVSYTAGAILGLLLAAPCWADSKDKKDSGKGTDGKQVIVIQLDLSKAPPGLVKQLLELSKDAGKGDDGKKSAKKDDDDDKKKSAKKDDDKKKGDDDQKKDDGKKANVVQVDLNKLPPDLAKRLTAELSKGKGGSKGDKDDDKKKGKDDDDDKKGKKDDDKKGGKKKDD